MIFFLFPDPVHAAVLAAGQAAAVQVVRGAARAAEEEGISGDNSDGAFEEAEDVLVPRVERPQDCVQTLCQPLLLLRRRTGRQRTCRPRDHTPIRRTARQILWQCKCDR